MRRAASLLASMQEADRAIRWRVAEDVGRIRYRADRAVYYLDFRPYGRVYGLHSVPFRTKKDAKRVLDEMRGKLAHRTLPEVLAEYLPVSAKPNLIPRRMVRWLEVKASEVESGNLSPGYLAELRRHAKPGNHFGYFDAVSIHEIRYGLLEDWVGWLGRRGLAPSTQRNLLLEFRSFCGWLWKREEIRAVPPFPTIRVPEYLPHTLTLEDQNRVLAAIAAPRRGAFLAMAHLGVRPGEARALRVADLELHEDGLWVVVRQAAKGPGASSPVRETKNRQSKQLPVRGELATWIDHYVDPRGRLVGALLFPNPDTQQMWGHEPLRRTWSRACAEVGVEIPLYQGTKHTLGTELKRRGIEDRLLQKLFGHKKAASVKHYALLADTELVPLVEARDLSPARPQPSDASRAKPKS